MVYDESVVVNHAHHLSLGSFHAQHFSYGRGAYPYWSRGAQNGNPFRIEPASFYMGILAAPFKAHVTSAPVIAALTLTTQIANAAGFFYEMAGSLLLDRSASFVDDSVFHHEAHALGNVNVVERIARNGNDVGKLSRLDRSDSLIPAE